MEEDLNDDVAKSLVFSVIVLERFPVRMIVLIVIIFPAMHKYILRFIQLFWIISNNFRRKRYKGRIINLSNLIFYNIVCTIGRFVGNFIL